MNGRFKQEEGVLVYQTREPSIFVKKRGYLTVSLTTFYDRNYSFTIEDKKRIVT